MQKINKEILKNQLAEKTGMTKDKSGEVINALLNIISENLISGNKITLTDFGTFYTTVQKGKEGKVPGTTKTYKSEDKNVVKFKVGKELKEKVQ